jgi:hypothetical protein
MSLKHLAPSLVLGLALTACSSDGSSGTTSSVSSITSTTTTGTTGAVSSLTVGEIVQVTFDATGAAATIVAGHGGFGHHGGMMAFGPLGGDGPEGMEHGKGTGTTVVDYTAFGVVRGPVDAVDTTASTLTLLGITITVDSSTTFGGVAALADVKVGAEASVRVTLATDGSLTARSVRVGIAGLGGALSAIAADGSSITVLGRTITVTAATSITIVEPPTDKGTGEHQGGMGMGGHGG